MVLFLPKNLQMLPDFGGNILSLGVFCCFQAEETSEAGSAAGEWQHNKLDKSTGLMFSRWSLCCGDLPGSGPEEGDLEQVRPVEEMMENIYLFLSDCVWLFILMANSGWLTGANQYHNVWNFHRFIQILPTK